MADPDLGYNADQYLVIEGEIKTMVTYQTLDDPTMQMLGIAGKNALAPLIDKIKGKGVWLYFDPDVDYAMQVEQAHKLGARLLTLPSHKKLDDLIVAGQLTRRDLSWFLAKARKV
jgi:hypothetical protein